MVTLVVRSTRSATRAVLAATLCALAATSCASNLADAKRASNAAAATLKELHHQIDARREIEQRGAARSVAGDPTDPDVQERKLQAAAAVGEKFEPIWQAYSTARDRWVDVVVAIDVAEDFGAFAVASLALRLKRLLSSIADVERLLDEPPGSPPKAPTDEEEKNP